MKRPCSQSHLSQLAHRWLGGVAFSVAGVAAVTIAGLLAIQGSVATPAWADSAQVPTPNFAQTYDIGRAAGIYVTPTGLAYFAQNKLIDILTQNDLPLDHRAWPQWNPRLASALKLDDLPDAFKPYQPLLNSFQDFFKNWLSGYHFSDPLFQAQVRNAGYELNGLEIELKIDSELTRRRQTQGRGLGVPETGVAFRIEATIPHLNLHAQDICANDANNPILGSCTFNRFLFTADCLRANPQRPRTWCTQSNAGLAEINHICLKNHRRDPEWCDQYASGVGVYQPRITLEDPQPLRASVPIFLQILPDGAISLQADPIDTNLENLNFALGHAPNLILPALSVELGNRRMVLKNEAVSQAIAAREQDFLKAGLHHLQALIVQDLPSQLERLVANSLRAGIATTASIDSPGIGILNDVNPLEFGLRASDVGLRQRFLYLDFSGYVTDREVPWDSGLPVTPPPAFPLLQGRDESAYDFAFALNNSVIQRAIAVGFNHNGLAPLTYTDKNGQNHRAEISALPILSSGTDGKAHLEVALKFKRSGFKVPQGNANTLSELKAEIKDDLADDEGWAALNDPYTVHLYLDLKVQLASAPHSFDIVVDRIDVDRSLIPQRSIAHFGQRVLQTLRQDLQDFNQSNATNPRKLTDTPITFPAQILPISIVQAEFDPNGYLVLYMNYGDRQP